MLTFVCDTFEKRISNLYPLHYNGQDLTEPCWLVSWLDNLHIDYNMVTIENATPESWYPVAINFWNFNCDYLQHLSMQVKEKLSARGLRLIFLYREADDPGLIKQHINQMSERWQIHNEQIWLISGNSLADQTPQCRFFWYFDINYFFQTKKSLCPKINRGSRDRKITCLARVHKQWREWFVYNLSRSIDLEKNYISYGAIPNIIDSDDINIWQDPAWRSVNHIDNRMDIIPPSDKWRLALPLRADNFDSEQHNDHSLILAQHYQNSYWNVVLETLLDTEVSGGVFVTEKTLKPIRNGQSFLVLGCAGTLAFLKSKGYQTFDKFIDESYDTVTSVHDRWWYVYQNALELANLSSDQLAALQRHCLPTIQHNQKHFQRDRVNEICLLTAYLEAI